MSQADAENPQAQGGSSFHSSDLKINVIMGLFGIATLLLAAWMSEVLDVKGNLYLKVATIAVAELGVAIIIALLLILTIEHHTRKMQKKDSDLLNNRVNRNVFEAFLKRSIPEAVYDEVQDCMLNNNVLRTDYSVDYRLDFLSDSDIKEHNIPPDLVRNYLACTIYSSYTLKNLTKVRISPDVQMHIELPSDKELHRCVEITDVKFNEQPLHRRKLQDHTDFKDKIHRIFRCNKGIEPDSSIRVQVTAKTIKRKLDSEVWASRLPSNGMTLTVRAPRSIRVKAEANHSKELKHHRSANDTSVWELRHGIFPFQSLIFWWDAR